MAAIILPEKWKTPPPTPRELRPEWDGLLNCAYVLTEGWGYKDAVAGAAYTYAVAGPGAHSYRLTSLGVPDSYVACPFNSSVTSNAPRSALLVGRRKSATGIAASCLSTAQANWYGWYSTDLTSVSVASNSIFDGIVIVGDHARTPDDLNILALSYTSTRIAATNGHGVVGEDLSFTNPWATTSTDAIRFGAAVRLGSNTDNESVTDMQLVVMFVDALPDEQLIALARAPYGELFGAGKGRPLYFFPSSTGISGSLVVTETGADTASISGDVIVAGSLAVTETGADTAAFTGSSSSTISGTLAANETGADTASLTGDVFVSGSLSATEVGSDSAAFVGDVFVAGSLAATEIPDTASITGDVFVAGTLAATETGADTALFNGSSQIITTGSLAVVETGADTAALSGNLIVTGQIAASESGADTATMTGEVLARGELAAIEVGIDQASISGSVYVRGDLGAVESGIDTAAVSDGGDVAVIDPAWLVFSMGTPAVSTITNGQLVARTRLRASLSMASIRIR